MEASNASEMVLLQRAVDNHGSTVAGIHVCDHWRAVGLEVGDHFGVRAHVVEVGDSEVGHPQTRCVCAGAGHVHAFETDAEGDTGGETVVDARADENVVEVFNHVAQACACWGVGVVSRWCSDLDIRCGFWFWDFGHGGNGDDLNFRSLFG